MLVFILAITFEGCTQYFRKEKKDVTKKLDLIHFFACIFVDICEASCTQEAPGGTENAEALKMPVMAFILPC